MQDDARGVAFGGNGDSCGRILIAEAERGGFKVQVAGEKDGFCGIGV